ncbi:ScyD/ScyE family protein [Thermocrispum municipale]|uniref:ScyD/ScyE family protein n=1 Tax=Thermocrispum municipale TaxID=37926 RepID=UPI00048F05BE|nr:ScyD/ScyE family protein [Thermocrispum municipale]
MRRSRTLVLLSAAGLAAGLLGAAPVAAGHRGGGAPQVVAKGLDNPRGLAFGPHGVLYVTEAGSGGDGPCFAGPEGDEVCWGASGAITAVRGHHKKRVVTKIGSLAAPDGSQAIGPSDISFSRGKAYFTVGLGADPRMRAQLPRLGQKTNGWLLKKSWHRPKGVADVARFELAKDPDKAGPDSNPNSVLAGRHGQVVVDSGGNTLLQVAHGKIRVLAKFPAREVPAPDFLGLPPGSKIPMQSVPTSVVKGPDGAYYVGELTGFPFPQGKARVYKVKPGHKPKVVASGFTNVIDIGFHHGKLYVLEIAHAGLLNVEQDPRGALYRVGHHGSKKLIKHDGLVVPGGLALRGGKAYISNCSTCPADGSSPLGTGHLLRVPLR